MDETAGDLDWRRTERLKESSENENGEVIKVVPPHGKEGCKWPNSTQRHDRTELNGSGACST